MLLCWQPEEEEDEETREYRKKIEQQKQEREKFLQLKEERRKLAALEKLRELQRKDVDIQAGGEPFFMSYESFSFCVLKIYCFYDPEFENVSYNISL